MASTNITISDDAYHFLKKIKRKDQSFSAIILSLREKRHDVLSYAGIFKNVDLSSVEKVREESSEDWAKR